MNIALIEFLKFLILFFSFLMEHHFIMVFFSSLLEGILTNDTHSWGILN